MQWSYQNDMMIPSHWDEKTCETCGNCRQPFPFCFWTLEAFCFPPLRCFSRWKIQWFLSCCWFCKQKNGLWSLRAKRKKIGSGKSSAAFCTWQGLVASESHKLTFFSMAFRFTWMENYDPCCSLSHLSEYRFLSTINSRMWNPNCWFASQRISCPP